MVFDTMVSGINTVADTTKLVFDTVDGTSYLRSILVRGQNVKNDIARSKAQARAIANGVSVTETVVIANTGF